MIGRYLLCSHETALLAGLQVMLQHAHVTTSFAVQRSGRLPKSDEDVAHRSRPKLLGTYRSSEAKMTQECGCNALLG